MTKKLILIGALILSTFGFAAAGLQAKPLKPRKIAVQTYSLNRFTLQETIEKLKGLNIDGIECYVGQKLSNDMGGATFRPEMSAEEKEIVKKWLADAKLKIVSVGVVGVGSNDKEVKKYVDFAKDFGFTRVITESNFNSLEAWDKYAADSGVTLALHNHGKSSGNQYWIPETMSWCVKNLKTVKASPDNGHWKRTGLIDALAGFKALKGQMVSIHFKDVDDRGTDCVYGTGVMNVKAILAELDAQKYDGFFVIEYENEWDNNVPSIKKCVEFLRKN